MRCSVILSTYNNPDWLEKVLWGYSVQTHRDFELIVADDGSTGETRKLLDGVRRRTALELRHVWHEDRGFRKCAILNKAIVAATGDYLVFSDGDCIPRQDFLERHMQLARPGCFLSGSCVRLPPDVSQAIGLDDIVFGRATDASWLADKGLLDRSKRRRLAYGPNLAAWLDALTPTRRTFNGCNSSVWKSAVLQVNGFDERMEYGGLDRELGERLINSGIRPIQVRHRAVCVHLDHPRNYVRMESLERNRRIRWLTAAQNSVWTDYGIAAHDSAAVTRRAA